MFWLSISLIGFFSALNSPQSVKLDKTHRIFVGFESNMFSSCINELSNLQLVGGVEIVWQEFFS